MRFTIYDLRFTRVARASRPSNSASRRISSRECVCFETDDNRGLPTSTTVSGETPETTGGTPVPPRFWRTATLSLVGLIFCLFLGANNSHAENLLLKNAVVHTVSSGTITNGEVFVQNGKIVQVFDSTGKDRKIIPTDTKEIDLRGLHLFPGMIALGTDLGLIEIEAVRATRDTTEVGDYTPDVESWIAVNPDSELLPVARANGVAYVEPVPSGGVVAGQSGLIALDGWTPEQMAIKKPATLHIYWPDMALDMTPKERTADKSKWKSPDDQAKERRIKLKSLEDFFEEAKAYAKAKAAGGKNNLPSPKKVPAWEAMLPYVRGELPITVHADDVREIKAAVAWATANKFKIILSGARDAWMVADSLATNQIPVIYKYVFSLPARETDSYDTPFKAPAILQKAGVTVVFSTGGASLVKNLPYHAAQAVAFGLPEAEALKGITFYPAQLMGVANRVGSIEAGKDATFFAADGNILDLRTNVKRMWIGGKEVSLESKHTRLYEKYKNRPKEK